MLSMRLRDLMSRLDSTSRAFMFKVFTNLLCKSKQGPHGIWWKDTTTNPTIVSTQPTRGCWLLLHSGHKDKHLIVQACVSCFSEWKFKNILRLAREKRIIDKVLKNCNHRYPLRVRNPRFLFLYRINPHDQYSRNITTVEIYFGPGKIFIQYSVTWVNTG